MIDGWVNANVGGDLNFRFGVLLKGAVILIQIQIVLHGEFKFYPFFALKTIHHPKALFPWDFFEFEKIDVGCM